MKQSAWSGIKTQPHSHGLEVVSVERNSPAWKSGVTLGDVIIALDGLRVKDDDLKKRLKNFLPGQTIPISFFRRDQLQSKLITLGKQPADKLQIKPVKKPNKKQKKLFKAWTGINYPKTTK